MTHKIFLLNFFILSFILTSCNTTEPPPSPPVTPEINLSLEDVSCTEAWIRITTNNLDLPATITLKQNDQTRTTINLDKADTLLYIDSLLPNVNYNFQASNIQHQVSSNELNVITLDTTSHSFTWQTWTFGEHSTSILYDVAIIDENNIWAVGAIYMNDSLGQPDPHAYNAMHWDGHLWHPKKITVAFRGNMITPPLEGAFAFSDTDIWFVGSLPIHGDGTNWTMYDLRAIVDPNLSLSKPWGKNSNDIYFVGGSGSMAHYNGSNWQKIESGITLPILDIWGEENNQGDYEIICVASNGPGIPQDMALLRIKNNIVEHLPETDLPLNLNSIWFIRDKKYFLSGDGLFLSDNLYKGWTEESNTLPFYKTNIRGIGYNNIFVVGAFGLVSHFNGVTWAHNTYFDARFRSVEFKDKIVVAVGRESGSIKAAILFGKQ